jgi:hypothetical protein
MAVMHREIRLRAMGIIKRVLGRYLQYDTTLR